MKNIFLDGYVNLDEICMLQDEFWAVLMLEFGKEGWEDQQATYSLDDWIQTIQRC